MAKRGKNDPGGAGTAVKERPAKGKISSMDQVLRAVEQTDGKKQRRPIFRKKRGGQVLTRDQVRAVKAGRKLLKKELKSQGLKKREDLDLMASSMGLYFDRSALIPLLRGILTGRGIAALAGALAALLGALFFYSTITQVQGHFTISMAEDMFKEGFVLSDEVSFQKPTTHLFSTPAENVPCISIVNIPAYVDEIDGPHNEDFFAYTFYLRNDGESTANYTWDLALNSESRGLAEAMWVMIFQDGEMMIYAKADAAGNAQSLPAVGDNSRGYINPVFLEQSAAPDEQYELITQRGNLAYYRVNPMPFVDEVIVAQGLRENMAPQEVHKYTVVIWLEGDDPDCTDELIGGHMGMELNMTLVD